MVSINPSTLTHLPDVSARQLLSIVTLAERGSFTTGAAALEISQSALSRTIQRLERTLGVPLFIRSTRRLEITPAGMRVVAVAERMLGDFRIALRSVGEAGSEQRGQVIVSAFPMFAHDAFPKIVRRFRQHFPHVVVQLRHGCNVEVLEDVSSGTADFGVAFVSSVPDTIHCVQLRQEPLCVIAPWSHPLAKSHARAVRLAELRGVDVVSLGSNSHAQRLIDGAVARAGFNLQTVVVAPGSYDVVQHVRAGVGVGIVPLGALPKRRDFAVLSLKAPALSMSVGLMTLRNRHLTPASARLMKMTLDYLKLRPGLTATTSRKRAA